MNKFESYINLYPYMALYARAGVAPGGVEPPKLIDTIERPMSKAESDFPHEKSCVFGYTACLDLFERANNHQL